MSKQHWSISEEIWAACLLPVVIKPISPGQNGCHLADNIFIFMNEKFWISIGFSLLFVPKGPVDHHKSVLVQVVACRLLDARR